MAEKKKQDKPLSGKIVSVQIVRKCPFCGRPLYEKLDKCNGLIRIKCPKCGRPVEMNLAMRRRHD